MSVTNTAREYAKGVVSREPNLADKDAVESLLFIAYLDGWRNAVQDERTFISKLQETARSVTNGR